MTKQNERRLKIKLFGDIQIWVDDELFDQSLRKAQKNRLFLARLLLDRGHSISVEKLAEIFYPDSSYENAQKNIWSLLVDVRRILEPELKTSNESRYIKRISKGTYQFVTDPSCIVDTEQFEESLKLARQLSRQENWSRARDAFREALNWYGGEYLEEHPYVDWTEPPRVRFRQLYVNALSEYAEAMFQLKDDALAIEICSQAIECDQHQEALYRQLMRYHAFRGERDAALATFESAVQALETVEAQPSAKLRELESQIATGVLIRPEQRSPSNLPHPLTSFIGRSAEIAEIQELLALDAKTAGGPRLITLTGPGGSGKTRLAIEAARQSEQQFPHGIWWTDLAPLENGENVDSTIAASLGLKETGSKPYRELIADRVDQQRMLFVIDNCEHLARPVAVLADYLLLQCSNLKILATSRIWLKLAGEQLYDVHSMLIPLEAHRLSNDELLENFDAIKLFVERARLRDRRFQPDQHQLQLITKICQILEGIPLNIEMAAALIHDMELADLADTIQSSLLDQPDEPETSLRRHESLRASIDWSFGLLTQAQRALVQALSVFKGGWNLDAAESIAEVLSMNSQQFKDLHSELLVKSLIQVAESPLAETRFRMLETVRQFAAEQLADNSVLAKLNDAHFAYFMKLAERIDPELLKRDAAKWMQRLDLEHDNFRRALRWKLDSGNSEDAQQLARVLFRYWVIGGHYSEGLAWLKEAMHDVDGVRPETRAWSVRSAGIFCNRLGFARESRKYFRESLVLFRKAGKKFNTAAPLNYLASFERVKGNFERARVLLEEALSIYREFTADHGAAFALNSLGFLYRAQGDLQLAGKCFRESASAHEEFGDLANWAIGLNNLGEVLLSQGDLESGRAKLEQSLKIRREIQDKRGIAVSINNLSSLVIALGEDFRAAQLQGAVMGILSELGSLLEDLEEVWFQDNRAKLIEHLGEAEYQHAFEAGQSLSVDKAIELALGRIEVTDRQRKL